MNFFRMGLIDRFLNGIAMYRLVLYGLTVIAVTALALSVAGWIAQDPFDLLLSLVLLLAACYATNLVFARAMRVPANVESAPITALILFLIFSPPQSTAGMGALALVGVVSIASKFLIAPARRHIFNPVAFGAFAVFICNIDAAMWWVATPMLLPVVAIVGALIVRKIRREEMVVTFILVALASITLFTFRSVADLPELYAQVATSWPLVFFATVMFTEPITMPPTRRLRLLYALLVGVVFGSQFHLWRIIPTPEFALLVGNIFSYLTGCRTKFILTFREKRLVAKDVYEFIFTPDKKIVFRSGQYLEFTLPHVSDSRGNRRYFTIASSPTEGDIRLGVKMYDNPSRFKKALIALSAGQTISAGQLAGDFMLPERADRKLALLAGGIGVTPFRSMIRFLVDRNERRDIVLYYAARSEEEIAYRELFTEASEIGVKTVYIIGQRLDEAYIREYTPDFHERLFYISGPDAMVAAMKKTLRGMGIKRGNIRTDYFPGLA